MVESGSAAKRSQFAQSLGAIGVFEAALFHQVDQAQGCCSMRTFLLFTQNWQSNPAVARKLEGKPAVTIAMPFSARFASHYHSEAVAYSATLLSHSLPRAASHQVKESNQARACVLCFQWSTASCPNMVENLCFNLW
jgi:hypothetical protein